MTIPTPIRQRLLEDGELGGAVLRTWSSVAKALNVSPQGMFFFPEWTDHAANHIQGVLASCERLITPDSGAILTPKDANVLVLATLLHDAAMHLDADLLLLLLSRAPDRICRSFDEYSWADEFDRFATEAARWNQRKLEAVFGKLPDHNSSFDWGAIIRQDPRVVPVSRWTEPFRKFLGEFVRRHHARIAHEIALGVFESSVMPVGLVLSDIDPKIRDLAGLIARSHNLPIRSTFEYLTREHGGRAVCHETHPVYLMGVLRIADYIQIDHRRVSRGLFGVRTLTSTESDAEWRVHLSVSDVRPDESDAESIYVFAEPRDASTFLKLRKLLSGLQQELDSTWAVFGEIYSYSTTLRKLGLTIRRVRSNLESPQEYMLAKSPSFFPIEASFRTADSALLKLLVKPLYGFRPEVAVRELLQNALDAVRELEQLRRRQCVQVQLREQPANVVLTVQRSGGEDWFVVEDQGIGMSAETVRDYFLTAGASFRNSDEWWKEFGLHGRSTVLRSGRFGIGALSAFLLGPKISVVTRHARSCPQDGVEFDATVDQEHVELRRTLVPYVGTTIRILLTKEAASVLRGGAPWWDWYTLDQPTVAVFVDGEKRTPALSLKPWRESHPVTDWTQFDSDGFEKIQWSYTKEEDLALSDTLGSRATVVACNGLRIGKIDPGYRESSSIQPPSLAFGREIFNVPNILFYDPDATLPLTLQRDALAEHTLSFVEPLLVSMSRDFIAFLLVHGPSSFVELGAFLELSPLAINMYRLWNRSVRNCLFTIGERFGVATPWVLKSLPGSRVLHFSLRRQNTFMAKNYAPLIPQIFTRSSTSSFEDVRNRMWMPSKYADEDPGVNFASRVRLLISRPDSMRYLQRITDEAQKEGICFSVFRDGGVLFCSDKSPYRDSELPSVHRRALKCNEENLATVAELQIDANASVVQTVLDHVWQDICGLPTVPFSPEERHDELYRAFESLSPHVAAWQSPVAGGWRAQVVERLNGRKRRLARH